MEQETKKKYKIRNWSAYNKALIERGNLTIWIADSGNKWIEPKHTKPRRGRPKTYSKQAILCVLLLKTVYHLPLRALEGLVRSILSMTQTDLPVPSYTQISRRAQELNKKITRLSKRQVRDIVIDSTGVKVYGEGEWKVRQHGKGKRRTWRKVHLAVCAHSGEIVLSELTDSKTVDGRVGEEMIKHFPSSTKRLYGDGAYDKGSIYKGLASGGIEGKIPPRKGGILRNEEEQPWMHSRNEAIKRIRELGNDEQARKKWKIESEYHRRTLAETAMSRFKMIFGERFSTRKMENQKVELYVKSVALNKMTKLGMPKGSWVVAEQAA